MNKIILIILVLFTGNFSTFADDHLNLLSEEFCYESPKVQVIDGQYYFFNQELPYSGENLCVYSKSGQYHSKGQILNGKREGWWSLWLDNVAGVWRKEKYEDGNLARETHFTYFDSGQQKSEVSYKKSKANGNWFFWNENGGALKKEQYENGNLVKETHFTYFNNGQ
ncbi:hypothetical protein N8823_04500, partial [Candidatus Pseudothioglobus singularis]|nr:hypothetical protein [Candidatus Pseudothioglobus singularis]